MKVLLYEGNRSLFNTVYSLTALGQTVYPHGAIWNNGKLYDTTFTRGSFEEVENGVTGDRTVAVCDIPGDCQDWIDRHLGAKYDVAGVILWKLGLHSRGNIFCYEVILGALLSLDDKKYDLQLGDKVTGRHILDAMLELGLKFELMQGKQFNERHLT
tara:strand:- start:571 stop:1041 length:471 start_codon:yes stop_codon:yes gene_type:complete